MVQSEVEEKSESIEEMLRQIKKIMSEDMAEEKKTDKPSSNAEEVFELSATAIIEEIPEEKVADASTSANADAEVKKEAGDVLENIDKLLDQKKEAVAPAEEVPDKKAKESSEEKVVEKVAAKAEEVKPAKEDTKATETPPAEPEAKKDEPKKDEAKKTENLVSEESAQASSEVLRSLIKTVEKPLSDGLGFRNGTTMEQLVIELIKPQLSKWLDENLPNIVKNVVEKEVKKLIPRDE